MRNELKLFAIIVMLSVFFPFAHAEGDGSVRIERIDAVKNYPAVDILVHVAAPDEGSAGYLSRENFRLYVDDHPVEIQVIERAEAGNQTLYLVLSLDSSKSLSRNFLARLKSSAREIIRITDPSDRIAVYRFNDRSVRLTEFFSNKKDLINAIEYIERHGSKTLLYDSLYDSLDYLHRNSGDSGAVIVFTDGIDDGSSITENDVIRSAQEKNIPLYFISIRESSNRPGMDRISRLTGGMLLFLDKDRDVLSLYRKIVSNHKNTYRLRYHAVPDSGTGGHTVRLELENGPLRGSDTKTVYYKRPYIIADSLTGLTVILLGLIFIFVLIITVTFLYFLKREKRLLDIISVVKNEPVSKRYDSLIELEETERLQEEDVLSSLDPEYTYASAWLVEKAGPETGKKFPIYWDEVTIGRARDNSIVVEDLSVSLKHARIKNVRNSFHLFDLVSENGTYLNGKKLLRPKALYDWDEIKVGRSLFIFRGSKRPH